MTGHAFRALAVEASTEHFSVAVCDGPAFFERAVAGPGEPSRQVYAWVAEVLDEAGLRLADLDCIAFGRGPGAFTGLRVAAAVAQGLGRGAGLPVCGISSLQALAQAASSDQPAGTLVAACLDARMGEVYAGLYLPAVQGIDVVMADCLADPDSMELPGEAHFLAIGPGWAAYPALQRRFADRTIKVDDSARPQASSVLRLAQFAFGQGLAGDPAAAVPNYLRNRVAVVSSTS